MADISSVLLQLPQAAYNIYDHMDNKIKNDSEFRTKAFSSGRIGVNMLYQFGDCIEKFFLDNPEMMEFAVSAWKKACELQQQWEISWIRPLPEKDYPTSYTAKIQKFDSSYTLAEKKGCLSTVKIMY